MKVEFYIKNLHNEKLSQKELFSTCHEKNSRYISEDFNIHEKLWLFSTNKQRRYVLS